MKKLLQSRNNRIMLVILIIGIAFIVFSTGLPGNGTDNSDMLNEYRGEEARLSEILSEIKGAGQVSVMISYVSTMEKDIAYDGENERAVTSGGNVVIKREMYPQVKGVIVIADGADDPSVRQTIKEAVISVTGAAANHVCVYSGNK